MEAALPVHSDFYDQRARDVDYSALECFEDLISWQRRPVDCPAHDTSSISSGTNNYSTNDPLYQRIDNEERSWNGAIMQQPTSFESTLMTVDPKKAHLMQGQIGLPFGMHEDHIDWQIMTDLTQPKEDDWTPINTPTVDPRWLFNFTPPNLAVDNSPELTLKWDLVGNSSNTDWAFPARLEYISPVASNNPGPSLSSTSPSPLGTLRPSSPPSPHTVYKAEEPATNKDSVSPDVQARLQRSAADHSSPHRPPKIAAGDDMIWEMKKAEYYALSAPERKRVRNRISARTTRFKNKSELALLRGKSTFVSWI